MMLSVAIYLSVQMLVVWLIAMYLKNPSVVDVAWAFGIMVSAGIYLFTGEITTRNLLIFALVLVWSIRLSGFILFTRISKGHIDQRYLNLSKNWKIKKSLGYLLNFQLQAFLSWVLAIAFLFPGTSTELTLSTIDLIITAVIILSIAGEAVADHQLQRYKASQQGGVCNIGLWQYSRHPNYFFEWLIWCGFCAFALRSTYGCFALLSPLMLYIILNYVTGPLTEKGSLKARGDAYRDYMKKTPMFWPSLKGLK